MSDPLSGFNNKDVIIVIDDTPGDTTVRPSPPEMRKRLEAEREKIRLWEEFLKQQEEKKKSEITDQGCEGKKRRNNLSSHSGFNSQDCIDIIFDEDDGPAEATV